jgi:hypothetical protein
MAAAARAAVAKVDREQATAAKEAKAAAARAAAQEKAREEAEAKAKEEAKKEAAAKEATAKANLKPTDGRSVPGPSGSVITQVEHGATSAVGGILGSGVSAVLGDTPEIATGAAGEVYYRTMSAEHYAQLEATGVLSATAETFISPTRKFSEAYAGTLVRLVVRPGTTAALMNVGVRDSSALTTMLFPDMPVVSKGWTALSAFFKGEGGQTNIGLGRGPALDIFNQGLIDFERLVG